MKVNKIHWGGLDEKIIIIIYLTRSEKQHANTKRPLVLENHYGRRTQIPSPAVSRVYFQL